MTEPTASPDPAKANAFAAETKAELLRTAPNWDLRGLADRALNLGLLSRAEAENLSLYSRFPDWLTARLESKKELPEVSVQTKTLIEQLPCGLVAPKGDFLRDSILSQFQTARTESPRVIRTNGGRSVHHVANFRKLSWASDGIIPPLTDANARVFFQFLEAANPVVLDGRTFLAVVEGSSIYTHWILDTLPRLLLVLEQEGSLDDYDHFLIATGGSQFHRFTLQTLGIERLRVVTRQQHGTLFSVDSFTHVSAPRHRFVAHPRIYDMVTAFFFPDMVPMAQTRRLYISRNKAKRRHILNEAEMFAALETRGFEMLHLEDLTIAEAARAMRSASHIVAAHGAGLSNLIFCQPGTRVMEIHSAHLTREYWVIANQRGLNYFGFEACGPSGRPLTPADRAAMGFFERNGLGIHVPMDRLLSLLDGAFLSIGLPPEKWSSLK